MDGMGFKICRRGLNMKGSVWQSAENEWDWAKHEWK